MRLPWLFVCVLGCASPRPLPERAGDPAPVEVAPAPEAAPPLDVVDAALAPSSANRPVTVIFEVVHGATSPLRLRIPSTGIVQTLFDDHVASPACSVRHDENTNALSLQCAAADGGLDLRAYQAGDELVLDIRSLGDVLPDLVGEHRFPLPAGSRVSFEAKLPTSLRPNPGTGVSGP